MSDAMLASIKATRLACALAAAIDNNESVPVGGCLFETDELRLVLASLDAVAVEAASRQSLADAFTLDSSDFRQMQGSPVMSSREMASAANELATSLSDDKSGERVLDAIRLSSAIVAADVEATRLACALAEADRRSHALSASLAERIDELTVERERSAKIEAEALLAASDAETIKADLVARLDRAQTAIDQYRAQRDQEGERATSAERALETAFLAIKPLMAELGGLTLGMLPPNAYGVALADAYTTVRRQLAI